MKGITIGKNLFLVATIIFTLSSCAVFRSNPDTSCVAQFADAYPNQQDSRFILPWKVGDRHTLTQGNCTLESHNIAQNQHMSFDFKMPVGTPIHAADDGRVFAVIEHFRDDVDNGDAQANLIGIEHENGILTWYLHLAFEGALVDVEDIVSRGDVIGSSGNTGNSAYPHLHFYAQKLTEECHDAENHTANLALCPQIPISFFNASPSGNILKEFVPYTALPYQGHL